MVQNIYVIQLYAVMFLGSYKNICLYILLYDTKEKTYR